MSKRRNAEFVFHVLNILTKFVHPAYLAMFALNPADIDDHSRNKAPEDFFIHLYYLQLAVSITYKLVAYNNSKSGNEVSGFVPRYDVAEVLLLYSVQDFLHIIKSALMLIAVNLLRADDKTSAFAIFIVTTLIFNILPSAVGSCINNQDITSRSTLFLHSSYSKLFCLGDSVGLVITIAAFQDHQLKYGLLFPALIYVIAFGMKLGEAAYCKFGNEPNYKPMT